MKSGWISPWWQAFALPDEWDVCGVVVPPITLWHSFALENIGNRYLWGGACTEDDAASLLMFVQRDMAHGKELLNPGLKNKRTRAILKVAKRLRKLEWSFVNAACREYVETCMRSVSRWQSGGSKPAAVPYQICLVSVLMKCMPIEQAWNTPYSQARCIFDAYAELKGDTSIMSTAAQEMEDNWDHYKDLEGTKEISLAARDN